MKSLIGFVCCQVGWHQYEELLDEAEKRRCWTVLPSDFILTKATYFRCKCCGKREIVLTVGFSSKMRKI